MSKRKSLNGMIESITTDIRKKTKAALEYAGEKISGDFIAMANAALDGYYNEYTKPPRQYRRTRNLHDDSFYHVNKRTGFKVNAGIIFDYERMTHKFTGKEKYTERQIFENFLDGIHGYRNVGTKINPIWEPISFGKNYEIQMNKYYIDYHNNNTAYNYFKEYMDRH